MARRSLRSRALSLVAPSLAALLAACNGEGAPCVYEVCAIEDPSCIERVAEAVGCHLDQEVIYPEVRFLSSVEFVAELNADATPLTAEQARDRDDSFAALALLGLLPEGYAPDDLDQDSVRNFVAFYVPDSRHIVMLTDRAAGTPEDDYLVLVHEMVHAYQDAAWDLAAHREAHAWTYDRFLGSRALSEGDAVHYQNLASVELEGLDPRGLDWKKYYYNWQQLNLQRALETETPALDVTSYFPYAFGGELVLEAWQRGGALQIEELWQRPPDSVRQVLGGFEAWPGRRVNEDAALDPQAVAVLPPGYELLSGGYESVWLINAMLQRTAAGGLWMRTLDEVSTDYLSAWRWNDSEVVAMWKIRSARPLDLIGALTRDGTQWVPREAAEFPTTHLIASFDSDVVLIAVSSGDAREVLDDIAGWQSPAEAYPDEAAASVRWTGPLDARQLGCAAGQPPGFRPAAQAARVVGVSPGPGPK